MTYPPRTRLRPDPTTSELPALTASFCLCFSGQQIITPVWRCSRNQLLGWVGHKGQNAIGCARHYQKHAPRLRGTATTRCGQWSQLDIVKLLHRQLRRSCLTFLNSLKTSMEAASCKGSWMKLAQKKVTWLQDFLKVIKGCPAFGVAVVSAPRAASILRDLCGWC